MPVGSRAVSLLWAKTGPEDRWHSLAAHMVDAAHIAGQLWDSWLAPATRTWLAEPLGAGNSGRSFFAWLAGCHDLGKASPAFQIQVPRLADQVREAGLDIPTVLPQRTKAPHARVSAVALGPLLADRFGWDELHTLAPAAILGGHHGWFPEMGFARDGAGRPPLYGWSSDPGAPWMAARAALFDLIVAVTGAQDVLGVAGGVDLGRARELALAGYVILADWLASNIELFPYTSEPFDPAYVETSQGLAASALHSIGWRRWDAAVTTPDFSRRFGFAPNALQSAAIAMAGAMPAPGLFLIEAPMGIGKTEAALAAVEGVARAHGFGGVFVALPTQATSNQMFTRATNWLGRLGAGTYVVELAHGKASQVREYASLHDAPRCVDVDEGAEALVTAEAWFSGPKRRLLAPFVVGTIDQALLCAAKVRHVALRQVGLVGKVVVVDEVHAYDAHMSVFLRRALRWLGAAGVPVILLSATLPPASRKRLVDAYVGSPVELGAVGYPSVTHVSPAGAVSTSDVVSVHPPRRVVVHLLDEAPEDPASAEVVEAVATMAGRGANVLLIRNTVRRAQRTAQALMDRLGIDRVTLLHARFVARDRLDKERWLTTRFGPAGDRPRGQVVVGTQVLEQSLDVDFDVLVTDLAPIDLVLQRAGRVHRHGGVRRPEGFREPRLVVVGFHRTPAGPPTFPTGSARVYGGEHLLLRSAAVLLDMGNIAVPDDVPALVARVYGDEDVVPCDWATRASEAADRWRAQEEAHERQAEQFAIPSPEGAPDLLELCRIGLGDPADDDPAVQAAVRDAPATIEVVVGTSSTSNGRFESIAGSVSLGHRPSSTEVERALASALRLPSWLTDAALRLDVPAGWQEHPWLRNLRPLWVGRASDTPVGKNVDYSKALGLTEVAGGGGG